MISTLDDDLARFVLDTVDLNATAVVIASDHGLHTATYPTTVPNGWVEMSSPFLVLLLPKWATTEKQLNSLRANEQQQRLTTQCVREGESASRSIAHHPVRNRSQ